tara:strand:- start:543 stop:1475 length:933 start_codon:yes stop_codon:yes gene_type:complete
MSEPKVTFGFVNCNRLHYLRSCVESLLLCTEDYSNKEIIVVDNASGEDGTEEYLNDLRDRGFKVFVQEERDPSNEYAKALNIIAENATGEYIASIPADVQFVVRGGWLKEYIDFFEKYGDTTGCISFDAQRKVRNSMGSYSNPLGNEEFRFLYHYNRNPVMGAMNCMVTREILDLVYPWETKNQAHEGGADSETKMLKKVSALLAQTGRTVFYSAPIIPVSIGIFNEKGGNARVRGDMRFGDYWSPPEDESGVLYYKIHDYEELSEKYEDLEIPVSIEDISEAVGWDLPIDSDGQWIKLKDSPDIVGVKI